MVAARLRRLSQEIERLGHLEDVGIALEQAPQRRLRAGLVARLRGEHGGQHERARCQPAVGMMVGDAQRRRPRAGDVTVAGERVRENEAHVVADGARQRRLARERLRERRGLAVLERRHRARPRALGLGGRVDGGGQQQRGRQQRQQHARAARLRAHHPPREDDALDGREVGQHGQHPERRLHDVEQGARDEADQPLGPLHHADVALHPDRLRARLRVADHDRAREARHRHQRAARVRGARVEHDDAEHHRDIGVAVDHRVEEGAERRHLPRGAR